jgi:hypothetical protein
MAKEIYIKFLSADPYSIFIQLLKFEDLDKDQTHPSKIKPSKNPFQI